MGDDALSAGAAARRLGVAVTTLRTWHQRYGLGPSSHEPGHHRRYTAEDMDRLRIMQRLTAQGVTPAEAASWARRLPVPALTSPDSPPPEPQTPVRGSGGPQALALGRTDPVARGLARAAMHLDAPAMRDTLDAAILERGVVPAWTDVIMPVLIAIGERYEASRRYVEVEHLLSRCVTEALGTVPRPRLGPTPRVLLAAADEEQHTLPLEALAAALAEAGVPCRLLGARVPPRALLDAVDRTGPAVVVLWSQLPATGGAEQLARLLAVPHPPVLIGAAGPGWTPDELPPEVVRLGSLPEAVQVIATAVA